MLNKLERKIGKYAIPNLILYLIGGYVIGYLLILGQKMTGVDFTAYLTLEPFMIIHHYQYWRLISWVLIPPNQSFFWAIIMMIFYYQLGMVLEQNWGTFRFNVYIFGGILFTVIGAFVMYLVYWFAFGQVVSVGSLFSTYYINMSIFLAFAVSYPDMKVMLYFIIPIKMKWMAVIYGVFIAYDMIVSNWATRTAILASLLNFLIYFLMTRNYKRINPAQAHRQQQFRRATAQTPPFRQQGGGAASGQRVRHKCAVCGRTDVSNPELQFRFCSKCNGNYEYCQDHLFTHVHKN